MAKLHIFNPDHDYALSVGINVYVSPRKIKKIAEALELIPIFWSGKEDYILKADNTVVRMKDGKNLRVSEIAEEIMTVVPWGWDHSLVMRLRALGLKENLFPAREQLIEMQRLSHRRISIDLNRALDFEKIPRECFSLEEAADFLAETGYAFFKAPWSSSGRGIVNSRRMPEENLFAWIKGIINKQGSVMAEYGAEKQLDCATLWDITDNRVEFIGFSISDVDDKGQYLGNYSAPQSELKKRIREISAEDLDALVEEQKRFVEEKIMPFHHGPLGIDMIVDTTGKIWPGIEINLRNTMGRAALAFQRFIEKNGKTMVPEKLNSLFLRLK